MMIEDNLLYTLSNNLNTSNIIQQSQSVSMKQPKQNHSYTEIFAWGCNILNLYYENNSQNTIIQLYFKGDSEGQMGLGENKSGKKQSIPRFCSFNVVIHQISCGKNHSAFIASNGYVYTMGSNDYGKLGLSNQLILKNAYSPQLVENIQKCKAAHISCGFDHTAVVAQTGELFTWGRNTEGQLGIGNYVNQQTPQLVKLDHILTVNSLNAKSISCGAYHTSVLLEYGEVCSFGQNERGQLGFGNSSNECQPKMNENIKEITTTVKCGYYHTLFLTKSMKVLGCGDNSEGQLGLGNKKGQTKPVLINKLENIEMIAARQHSAAINSKGELFLFGTCMFGEFLFPQKVHNLKKAMRSVSLGDNFGCVIDNDGQLYSWGYNENGQLGLGDNEPRILPTPMICLKGKKATRVECGQNYCISLGGTIIINPAEKQKKQVNIVTKNRADTYHNESVDDIQNKSTYDIPEQNLIPFFRKNSQTSNSFLTSNKPKANQTHMTSNNSQFNPMLSQQNNNQDCSFISSPEKSMYQQRIEEMKNVPKNIKQTQLDLINNNQQIIQPSQQQQQQQHIQFNPVNHTQNNYQLGLQNGSTSNSTKQIQNTNMDYIPSQTILISKQLYGNRQQNISNQMLPIYSNHNNLLNEQSPLNLSAIEQPTYAPITAFVSQNYAEEDDEQQYQYTQQQQPQQQQGQQQTNQQQQQFQQLKQQQPLQQIQNKHNIYDSNQPINYGYDIANYKKQFNMINQKVRSKSQGKNILKENSNMQIHHSLKNKNIIETNSLYINSNSTDTSYLLQQGASQVFSKFNKSFNQDFENPNQVMIYSSKKETFYQHNFQSFDNKKHSQSYCEDQQEKGENWNKIVHQKELIIKRLKEEITEIKEDKQQELTFVKQQLEQEKVLNQKLKEQVDTLKKREIQMTEQINQVQTELNLKIKEAFELQNILNSQEKKAQDQSLLSTKHIEQISLECNNYKKKIKEFELRLLDESSLNYQNYIHQIQQKDSQNEQLRNIIQNLEIKNKELEDTVVEFNQTGTQHNFWKGTQQMQNSNSFQNTSQIKQEKNNKSYLNSSIRKPSNDSSRIHSNNASYTQQLSPYLQHQTSGNSYQYQQNFQHNNTSYSHQPRCISPTHYNNNSNQQSNNNQRQPFSQISVNQMKLANIVSRSPIQKKQQNQYNQQTYNKSQRDLSNTSSASQQHHGVYELEQQKQQSQSMIHKFEKSANKILTMLTSESPEKYTFDQNDIQNDQIDLEASFNKDQNFRQEKDFSRKDSQDDNTPKQQTHPQFSLIYRDISNFEAKDHRSKSLEKRMLDFEKRLKESSQKNK